MADLFADMCFERSTSDYPAIIGFWYTVCLRLQKQSTMPNTPGVISLKTHIRNGHIATKIVVN